LRERSATRKKLQPLKYLCLLLLAHPALAAPLSEVDSFNTTLGTQTIGASYQFTTEPRLIETARARQACGRFPLHTLLKYLPPAATKALFR